MLLVAGSVDTVKAEPWFVWGSKANLTENDIFKK